MTGGVESWQVCRVSWPLTSNGGGLCETALTGAPLWTQLSRSNFAALAAKAAAWQVALAGDALPAST